MVVGQRALGRDSVHRHRVLGDAHPDPHRRSRRRRHHRWHDDRSDGANAAGARDAIGNLGAIAATTPLDKAKPAAITIADTNGISDGKPEPGDTLVISEALAPASVPASTTVTFTDPVGAGNDTLTMAGVSNGARTTGGANYITIDGAPSPHSPTPPSPSATPTRPPPSPSQQPARAPALHHWANKPPTRLTPSSPPPPSQTSPATSPQHKPKHKASAFSDRDCHPPII